MGLLAMMQGYKHGWYLVAFERELCGDVTPAAVGLHRLVLIRSKGTFRAVDADCPHRGAHLGYGGRLDGEAIICPFHGLRIGVGLCGAKNLRVSERTTLSAGGLIFVRLSSHLDCGFARALRELHTMHVIVPGYEMHVSAPADLIIENGFDTAHFRPVHGVSSRSFSAQKDPDGSFVLVGSLLAKRSAMAREFGSSDVGSSSAGNSSLPLTLRAFSPGLSILEVGGAFPYTMIVGATPDACGASVLRVSIALSRQIYGEQPSSRLVDHLTEASRLGIEADRRIWEQLSRVTKPTFLPDIDDAVISFRQFCAAFEVELPA